MKFLAISNKSGGYNLFDLDNEWIGYFVPDGMGGFLQYDLDGEWIGFVK